MTDPARSWEYPRRRGWMGAAAGVVVLVGFLLFVGADEPVGWGRLQTDESVSVENALELELELSEESSLPGGFAGEASGQREPLPEAPFSPRTGAFTVWTGEELLVFGGYRDLAGGDEDQSASSDQPGGVTGVPDNQEQRALRDGGRLAPGIGEWVEIPEAPTAVGVEAATVWTGEELIVWGGLPEGPHVRGPENVPTDEGARFDPATGEWRRLPEAPIDARMRAASAWTGQELWVVGGLTRSTVGSMRLVRDAAAYDPESDSWRELPELPRDFAAPRRAGWMGDRFLVLDADAAYTLAPGDAAWDRSPLALEGVAQERVRALMDPQELDDGRVVAGLASLGRVGAAVSATATEDDEFSGTWRAEGPPAGERPASDRRSGSLPPLVVGDLLRGDGVAVHAPAGLQDLRSLRLVSTGDGVMLIPTGWSELDRAALAWAWWRDDGEGSSRWELIPAEVFDGREGAVPTWTGDALVLWGGHGRTDGVRWLPERVP